MSRAQEMNCKPRVLGRCWNFAETGVGFAKHQKSGFNVVLRRLSRAGVGTACAGIAAAANGMDVGTVPGPEARSAAGGAHGVEHGERDRADAVGVEPWERAGADAGADGTRADARRRACDIVASCACMVGVYA